MERAAHFVEPLKGNAVRCTLCPNNCSIDPGESGTCLTRLNKGGELKVVTYGRFRAVAIDPVEKKPLFHYRPGSTTFSLATAGCNLVCPFCQNHSLSQALRDSAGRPQREKEWSPAEVVTAASAEQCRSISFTYSEPVLSFEFAMDTKEAAQGTGMDIIFVTNGQANEKPAREMAGFLAAANVDLKSSDSGRYKHTLGGSLSATKRTIEIFSEAGVLVEVTTLVIPGFNDSPKELGEIAAFLSGTDPHIPWHVSRFHPDYRWLDRGSTPEKTLKMARDIGLEKGLKYVYVGNLTGHDAEHTYCPGCGAAVIERTGFRVWETSTEKGRCSACGELIRGVGIP